MASKPAPTPKPDKRVGGWISTFSGVEFYPLDPRASEVHIVDIAHSLSNICRFNGHCRSFYSVAEHCVHVSRCVPEEAALFALLHDASEAYMNDLVRPIKGDSMLGTLYKDVELRLQRVILTRFDLIPSPDHEEAVHNADNAMLYKECHNLLSPPKPGWERYRRHINYNEPDLQCWAPTTAEVFFLGRYYDLTGYRQPRP